jgi:hypothetical protein
MISKKHSKHIEVKQIRTKWINRILFTSTLCAGMDLNVDIYTMDHRGTLTYNLTNNNSRVLYNKPCKETYQSIKVNNGQKSRNFVRQTLEWTLLTNLPSHDLPLWKGKNGLPPLGDTRFHSSTNTITHAIKVENESTLHRQKASQTLHANNSVFERERITYIISTIKRWVTTLRVSRRQTARAQRTHSFQFKVISRLLADNALCTPEVQTAETRNTAGRTATKMTSDSLMARGRHAFRLKLRMQLMNKKYLYRNTR